MMSFKMNLRQYDEQDSSLKVEVMFDLDSEDPSEQRRVFHPPFHQSEFALMRDPAFVAAREIPWDSLMPEQQGDIERVAEELYALNARLSF